MERSCRVRVRVAAICLTMASLLAGCAQRPLPAAQVAPDPFGYLKRSAVCKTSRVSKAPAGESVGMTTRSDDGLCGVVVSQPEGGAYASFLLTSLPMHGNSFIYNYNRQTHVTYTATTAYAGPDAFTVSLVTGAGRPRTTLRVGVSVDATGVALPSASVKPGPVKPEPKTTTRGRSRRPSHHGPAHHRPVHRQ